MRNPFSTDDAPTPPYAAARPKRMSPHGREAVDDYAWMRASNWKQVLSDPSTLPAEIRDHLHRENAYSRAVLADCAPLQRILVRELSERLPSSDASVWTRDGPFEYGQHQVREAELPQIVRRPTGGGAQSVLVDLAIEAKGRAYFRAGFSVHSPTHRMLAWFVDDVGSERFTVRFRDLATGRDLPECVRGASVGGAFSIDGRFFLYVGLDDSNRKKWLIAHRLGESASCDRVLLEEHDPRFSLNVRLTQSRTWFVASSQSHEATEVHLIPGDNPLMPAVSVNSRTAGCKYYVDEANGLLYALTNAGGASDGKIAIARIEGGKVSEWQDLIAHRPGTTVVGHRVYQRHLVWLERHDGAIRAMTRRHRDGKTHALAPGDEVCALDLGLCHEFDTDVVRLVYSSMRTPPTTLDCDMNTGALARVRVQPVAGGFDEHAYMTRQIFARSDDGVEVPVSLVVRCDTPLDGTAPCLLFGYGAYGVSLPAQFDADRLCLLDRGFVWAIAHVRGGGERGAAWHSAGKGEFKPSGVRDFIAVARTLASEGYVAPGRIVAHGVSAGGALVAAAVNAAPDTFAAVIAEAPFVDVLNTMLDATLPLTPLEWPEWGDPAASAQVFEQIACWSPYENVKPQAYPPVLAMHALTDPRVTYWEAAKWTARLRARQTANAPILLLTRFAAGHGGASGRSASIADAALRHAFALKAVGLTSHLADPSTP